MSTEKIPWYLCNRWKTKPGVKKGNTPWNKGKKKTQPPNSGSFQKGRIPWNKKNGETRNASGYIMVAIGYDPKTRRQIQEYKHRKIMEEYLKCKLESSLIVHHRDGNRENNELDNLEVMTQSEHLRRHWENK